jgi:hypothetical protein
MSLDLDADVLLTEQAPISALVQRFPGCVLRAAPAALGYQLGTEVPSTLK